ncbi:PREDICTED: lipase 1-like [Nicrophorus vespilloides]|uniref:Lipase n=1 Tax=Nicrophorus vespilloides TaxID=110193 RepID=A0ABM1NIH9_NICVS|nr:PREDICTED: lipase 1-like [Nicrophorus vespilloides]
MQFLLLDVIDCHELNVCKEFYQYPQRSDGCYHNPDQYLEVTSMIQRYGFNVESYEVITEDGYILKVFRIPNPSRPPVFLQHGITISCICFTNSGNHSIAFLLHQAGYDVWLGNYRGNRYSSKHVKLKTNDIAFWDFSFHENGKYDMRVQMDLVKGITGKKLYYIGYSMGTTAAYIYNILYPEEAEDRVKLFINLAPILYLRNLKSIVYPIAPFWSTIEPYVMKLTNGVIFRRTKAAIEILKRNCLQNVQRMLKCQLAYQNIFGYDIDQFDPEIIPITLAQNLEAASIKTISHYYQVINSDEFRHYDYGIRENIELYGTVRPPIYNLSKLTVPVYLIYGQNDYVSTVENVERLYNELPKRLTPYGKYKIPYEKFNHMDFTIAKDRKALLYDHLINFLNQISQLEE